jgi:hypothetical protein
MKITAVATLVNENALLDLQVLLFTLELWNPEPPTVYIYTNTVALPKIKAIPYSGTLHTQIALDRYTGLNRAQMERLPGRIYTSLFADFCAEKPRLLRWALETESVGVLFCDADICHLGPLPELPEGCQLALSPHMIREGDERKFGRFNAGFLFMGTRELTERWEAACATSRFFEQACLEDLWDSATTYEFPIQNNYGWWRLFQSPNAAEIQKSFWGILRKGESHSGIVVVNKPLLSIHTHWTETKDFATRSFNLFVLDYLKKLSSLKKTQALCSKIERLL